MSYDVKCAALARFFLTSQRPIDGPMNLRELPTAVDEAQLAQHIQDSIEEWLERWKQWQAEEIAAAHHAANRRALRT